MSVHEVATVSFHTFTVGGFGDQHETNVLEALGKPGRSLRLYNNAAVVLWFQFSGNGHDWSEPMYIVPAAGFTHNIFAEDGVEIHKVRVWANAINGIYTMQVYPGPGRLESAEKERKFHPTSDDEEPVSLEENVIGAT